MTALVDDLLLLARSDSGAIVSNRLPVDLGDVAAEGAGALVQLAGDRGVSLGLDPEPAMVRGDQARLRQLMVILVDNAVRHTPRGGRVLVRVRGERQEVDRRGRRRRAGHPAGGHAEGLRPVLARARGSASGGTGLGLAIAKSIVDLHEGRITVDEPARGRRPFHRPAAGGRAPPAPATETGRCSRPTVTERRRSAGAPFSGFPHR